MSEGRALVRGGVGRHSGAGRHGVRRSLSAERAAGCSTIRSHTRTSRDAAPARRGDYARRVALVEKRDEQRKAQRAVERREQVNKRDGHLSKEQRVQRFQEVIGACGMDKQCMKRALNQEDAQEGDMVVF